MIAKTKRLKVFDRDGWACVACGVQSELTLQHRINRGMGGSKLFDGYECLIVLCAGCNTRLEQDADYAELGRRRGWKLPRNRRVYPAHEPVFYHGDPRQWLLDEDGERRLDEPAF